MKNNIISDAVADISTEYIEKAADYTVTKKTHRPVWMKWGAVAACLCFFIVSAVTLLPDEIKQTDLEEDVAPNFAIGENTFMISSHLSFSEELPESFSYAGKVDIAGVGSNISYYTNPDMPEWVYAYHKIAEAGGTAKVYVRYVDLRLRGKDLLCCNDTQYISMWSINLLETTDVSKEDYDVVEAKYGNRIEGSAPDGFVYAGTAAFSGYDTFPVGALSSNTKEAKVYLSESEPGIALIANHWYTSSGKSGEDEVRHEGFNVYIRWTPSLK